MDDKVENLSDEIIELYASFECEESVENAQDSKFSASGLSQTSSYSHNNIFLPSANGYSADISFNTNDTAASNLTRTFPGLSLNYSNFISTSKLKELKTALAEANDVYTKYMIRQFVFDCYKSSEERVSLPLAHKMRKIMSASRLDKLNCLKTRNGKTLNVLGLINDTTHAGMNVKLTSTEAQELREQGLNILEENLEQLTERKTFLKDVFRPHCEKVVEADSLLPREHVRLVELQQELGEQLMQGSQLNTSTSLMLQQLATLAHSAERDLGRVTFHALRDKAAYLHTVTSVLRLKAEQAVNKDVDRVKAINNLGDELKTSKEDLSHRLKSLRKTLAEYEKREETSKQYKDIVSEYAKSKRLLNHKLQTLSLLNESNISFS